MMKQESSGQDYSSSSDEDSDSAQEEVVPKTEVKQEYGTKISTIKKINPGSGVVGNKIQI